MKGMAKSENFIEHFVKRFQQIKPPLRPSEMDSEFYEKFARKFANKGADMLILGATPELRDIALKNNILPVSCDLEDNIFEAMTRLMKTSGKEEFIHSNWLDLKEDRKFDLIMGDGSLNMLPADYAEVFMKKIYNLLKNNGFFVHRFGITNEKMTLNHFKTAMQQYRKEKRKKRGKALPIFSYVFMLAESLRNNYYPDLTSYDLFQQILFKDMLDEEKEEIEPFLIKNKSYHPKIKELHYIVTKYFEILETKLCEGTGYWGGMIFYAMIKK